MSEHDERHRQVDRFMTTQWTVVMAAGQRESPQSQHAMASLCGAYWYPLYAFVRRQSYSHEEAQDLTQEFFARLLEKNYVSVADPQRGRFRSFLLGSIKHFLSHQRDRAQAKKRGGGRSHLSLDFASAQQQYQREPADTATPERLFQRRWALTLLDRVLMRLKEEYTATGKGEVFECLKEHLMREKGATPYRQVAEECDATQGAIKVAVHRLRRRYRALLEDEISQTVSTAAEMEDEMQQLLMALSSEKT